jgi:peptidyl-prolyl cis-trans isomerase C
MTLAKTTLLAVLIALGSGCSKQPQFARINGKTIDKAQFEAYLRLKRIPNQPGKQLDHVIDEYLEREALADAIEREGTVDKQLIAAELNEFRKEVLISRYFEKHLSDKVTDQAVHNFHETNVKNYEDTKVHVAHILIRTNPKMSEQEHKAKLLAAQEAYSAVRSGKDFAEVARAKSEDLISAKKGGDLGWVKQGSIDQTFSSKVFALQPGELSEPFESAFGFHVVKVLEAPQTVRKPFDAVAGDIRHRLRTEAKQAEIDRLKAQAKIERPSKKSGA